MNDYSKINGGFLAPDYILFEERNKDEMINELKYEVNQLNNIINGMEKFFEYEYDNEVRPLNDRKISVWTICLDKLKELKESGNNE